MSLSFEKILSAYGWKLKQLGPDFYRVVNGRSKVEGTSVKDIYDQIFGEANRRPE